MSERERGGAPTAKRMPILPGISISSPRLMTEKLFTKLVFAGESEPCPHCDCRRRVVDYRELIGPNWLPMLEIVFEVQWHCFATLADASRAKARGSETVAFCPGGYREFIKPILYAP